MEDSISENFLLESNVPLAQMTTLGVGGPARFFVRAATDVQIAEAVKYAAKNGIELFVLGGGSNIIVSDAGFDGLVLQICLKGISVGEANGGRVSIVAAAGEDWDGFVAFCTDQGLAGVECLSGIPGFVGGTPVQNVGAYGQEVAETIKRVRCFDRTTLEFVDLSNTDCGFEYRKSIFNTTAVGRYIVTEVKFEFECGGKPRLDYKDLAERFAGKEPGLRDVREAVIEIRRSKSMVIDPADVNSRSAGSFFKNPIVEKSVAAKIGNAPHFRVSEETVKIPAAWLIEQAGFSKGYRVGNAGISENHSLAIVNCGGASAAEVIALKEEIQRVVHERFGIRLQPEPVFVGFDA